MIPIMNTFLQDEIWKYGIMNEHVRCFAFVEELVAYLSLGPHAAMRHVARIKDLILEHGELFVKLYPDQVRPKFHHLYHIIDNMEFVNALIARAVLTKDATRETRIVALCNRQCTRLTSRCSTLLPRFLIMPTSSEAKPELETSQSAFLPIGKVHNDDVVFLRDGSGKSEAFLASCWG